MRYPTYVTREELAQAADVKSSAAISSQLDRIIAGASRLIDERYHRHFFPVTASYTFEPDGFTDPEFHEWGFWLNADLLSISAVTVDGTAVTSFTLQPQRHGPPYGQILITSGSEVVISGVWGYTATTTPAGTITADLDDAEAVVGCSNAALIGIGDMFTVGSERFIVYGRSLVDTGATAGDLTAVASDNSVTLSSGALVNEDEVITIGAERMRVIDIAGNTAIVVRAVDGSTLAAHSGSPAVYAPRALTVERAATGSTAATHTDGDNIYRHVVPGPIRDLALAEALTTLEQERAGYGRVIGSGDATREAAGKGLEDVRMMADVYRRQRIGLRV